MALEQPDLACGEVVDAANDLQFAGSYLAREYGLRSFQTGNIVLNVCLDGMVQNIVSAIFQSLLYTGTQSVHQQVDVAGKGFFFFGVLNDSTDGSAICVTEHEDQGRIQHFD